MQHKDILVGESFMRLAQIIAPDGPIPVSRSTWWSLVRAGVYPPPVKLGPRVTAWRKCDIRALVHQGVKS